MCRLPLIRGTVTIIFLEQPWLSSLLSKECDDTIAQIISLNKYYVLRYTSISKCMQYLKRTQPYENMILITFHDSIATINFARFSQCRQIRSVFIVSSDKMIDYNHVQDDISKRIQIFHDYPSILDKLEHLMSETQEFDDDLFAIFNERERSLKNVRQELGPFVWTQSYKNIVMEMPHDSAEAKRQMLADCRARYRGNPQQLAAINEFQRTYRPEDAIYWYTKPCFVFHIINTALRTEDVRAFYTYRYFIADMCRRLEDMAKNTKYLHTDPFLVYRGSKLSRDEVEKLRIGTLVATNGFFSSSRNLDVVYSFLSIDPVTGTSPSRSREAKCQYVLFEIEVDFVHSPDITVADVSHLSAMPEENEMIFNLGTTFIIINITYDPDHYLWNVRMVSSSEVAKLNRDYNAYIRDRLAEATPTILFGNLLAEMTGDFPGALTYFHRLLRTVSPDDEDRPNIYYEIARVYRFMGKYQQAITYFRSAQLLQRRRLPEWTFSYGLTLASLGTAYSEIGNSARAIDLHTRSMLLHRRLFLVDHVDMAYHLEQLANDYWQEGQYERSLSLVSRSLFLFEKGMPVDFPGQARALHTMGIIQHSLGNWEKALHYLTKALRMRESLLAADHPFVARTCYQMSVLYAERESEIEMALTYARRALNICQNKLQSHHSELKKATELVERLVRRQIIKPP